MLLVLVPGVCVTTGALLAILALGNGCAILLSKHSTLGASQMASVDGTRGRTERLSSSLNCVGAAVRSEVGYFSAHISAGDTLLINTE